MDRLYVSLHVREIASSRISHFSIVGWNKGVPLIERVVDRVGKLGLRQPHLVFVPYARGAVAQTYPLYMRRHLDNR